MRGTAAARWAFARELGLGLLAAIAAGLLSALVLVLLVLLIPVSAAAPAPGAATETLTMGGPHGARGWTAKTALQSQATGAASRIAVPAGGEYGTVLGELPPTATDSLWHLALGTFLLLVGAALGTTVWRRP